MGDSVLAKLAEWAASAELDDLPSVAISTAKRSILDCIGVTIAALDEPLAKILDDYLSTSGLGSASIVGRSECVTVETAALVNGALAHALDFDDVSHTMGGHPTIPALWSAFAVAEAAAVSGAELLRAYCIGVEVETALARGLNFHHYDKGWHPTATLGTFGATAAAGAIHRLTPERMTAALAYATTTASGIKSSFGTMAKPIQVGHAVQSGVFNAAVARAGATANQEALEAVQGFANVYNGAGTYDLNVITKYLADPWDLVDPGIAIKLHPCCGGTHAAVDAAIKIQRELEDSDRVESVDAYIHRRRLAHLDRPAPNNPLDAKFSLQHTVALALSHGAIRMDHFTDDAVREPRLAALRDRIRAHPLPSEREGPEHFAAEIHVHLADGSERIARMERPRGRTPETALTDEDIITKFRACADAFLGTNEQDELIALVGDLENQLDVVRLAAMLRGCSSHSGSARRDSVSHNKLGGDRLAAAST